MEYRKRRRNFGGVIIIAIDERTGDFVLVIDPTKPWPRYVKFPGGGIKAKDRDWNYPDDDIRMAETAARREAFGETGLRTLRIAKTFKHAGQYVCVALGDFSELIAFGNDQERVLRMSLEEIYALGDAFMPSHRPYLEEALAFLYST